MGTKYDEVQGLGTSIDWGDVVQQTGPVRCVVADHPGCQVTCAGGECVAFYHEPSGPCIAQCLGGAMQPIKLSDEFSLHLAVNDGQPVVELFKHELPKDLADALGKLNEPIRLKGRFTREEFVLRLWKVAGLQIQWDDQAGST
jgi:hypothetical protein